MTCKKLAALIACVGMVATLDPPEAFSASGAAPHGWGPARHATFRSPVVQSLWRWRNRGAGLWPVGGSFYGPGDEGVVPVAQPVSGDIHYTFTNDVPWDWVHRYPPLVAPSDRPYVPSCTAETQTFPGRDGEPQTISVTRCY